MGRRPKHWDRDAPTREPVAPAVVTEQAKPEPGVPPTTAVAGPAVAQAAPEGARPPSKPDRDAEAPLPSRPAVAKATYKPPPSGPRCPRCGKALKVIVSNELGRCSRCHEVVAKGEQVNQYLERKGISEVAMNHFSLKPADLIDYLPSPGSGGIRVIRQGKAVKLYTKRGVLVYNLSDAKPLSD